MYANKRCKVLREEIMAYQRRPDFETRQDVYNGLQYQLNDFQAIKVMSFICMGE